ncbi:MAG TPA: TonB-dependent receptor, partial [Candidatus Edwardsbacteria bacterium]|nr:TonB-dependent receptor [Candidatus Edwardsbacteria bacterium]
PTQSAQTALAGLAGASLGANGGTGSTSSLYLRGAASENVLVLLDGIPLNSSLMGLYDLTKISGNAGRIEVVRGVESSLYGANAVGGVVNITTPEPDSGRPHSRVTYQKGDYGGQQLMAQFSRSLAPKASMWLGVDWTADGGQRRNSAYDGTNYSVGANIGPYRGVSAKGFLQIYKAKVGVPGSLSYPDTVSTQWDDQQDMQLRLGHRCTVGGQEHNGYLAIARSDIETKYYDGYTTTKNKSRQSTVNGQYTLALLPGWSLTAGGDYLLSECRSDNSGDHDLRQKSLFCNNLYSGFDGLLLTAGVRWDKNLYYKYQVSPSLAASYRINKPLTAYASYGQAYRAPTVNELFWKDDVWMMYGDPGLRPEHSWQAETGLKAYLDWLTATGCYFHRTTRDLITWATLPDWSLHTENVYGALTDGVEATLSVRPLSWLRADINYTWCRTERDDSTHAVLPYHPQNTANANLVVDDLRLADKLWWGWKFTARYTDCQNPGPYYDAVLPATVICDHTVSLRIWNARLYWRLDNLFNAEYQTRYGYPMPRRNYAVGVSMEMWE